MSNITEKVTSFQVLRALAFLGVFLGHAGMKIQWAGLSVSVFFVLSGFLMCSSYKNREMYYSAIGCVRFSIAKIKRLYPLHLITTFAMFFLICAMDFLSKTDSSVFLSEIFNVILNLLLIQSFIPSRAITLNGVSWYLSTAFFVYMAFPFVHRYLRKKDSLKESLLVCATVVTIDIIISMCMPNNSKYEWFTYISPFYRVGDFIVGYSFGNVVRESPKINNCFLATLFELIVFAIAALSVGYISLIKSIVNNTSLVFLIPACLLIYIFNSSSGLITKVLCNRGLIYLGDISAYTFLVHAVIITYITYIIYLLGNANMTSQNCKSFAKWFETTEGSACCLLLEFFLTVTVAMWYARRTK